ncbi:MAG TPA: ABC transporter ATP-binding protein [Gammaproteobacteria bacterium]|nr:ABC transporter ATP-binding protein [Gammaproteobacteria bacterium]
MGKLAIIKSLVPDIRDVLLQRKLGWGFLFGTAYIVPILEIAVLVSAYLIFDSKKRNALFSENGILGALGFGNFAHDDKLLISSIFIMGLMLVIIYGLTRYLSELTATKVKVYFSVVDSHKLIDSYLNTSLLHARRIDKERITSSIIYDCGSLAGMVRQWITIIQSFFGLVTYMLGAIWISWKMVLVILVIYVVPLYITRHLYSSLYEIGKSQVLKREAVVQHFADFGVAFERSRVDGLESLLGPEALKVVRKSKKLVVNERKTKIQFTVINESINLLGLLALLYVGTVFIGTSAAILIAMLVMFNRVKTYINAITGSLLSTQTILGKIERFNGLINELQANGVASQAKGLTGSTDRLNIKKIEAKDVGFSYDNKQVLFIDNFRAQAGDRILIQGPSGHGKTTFLELICGLLTPTTGKVLLNGKNLDSGLFNMMRQQLAYVSQNVFLFRKSIRKNLMLDESVDMKSVEKVIKSVGLQEFIAALPDGIDTNIGPNGAKLSLGQRQRIVLARLFLKKPNFILLDEATANLDQKQEKEIMKSISSFIDKNSILMVVAHKVPGGITFNKSYWLENGILHEDSSGR